MANGISVKLPLIYDKTDGPWRLNKTYQDMVKQNVRMLFLTNPGERIMDPGFGVGIYRFLFEQIDSTSFEELKEIAREQVDKYLPFIDILDMSFDISEANHNLLKFKLSYKIIPINLIDSLFIETGD